MAEASVAQAQQFCMEVQAERLEACYLSAIENYKPRVTFARARSTAPGTRRCPSCGPADPPHGRSRVLAVGRSRVFSAARIK